MKTRSSAALCRCHCKTTQLLLKIHGFKAPILDVNKYLNGSVQCRKKKPNRTAFDPAMKPSQFKFEQCQIVDVAVESPTFNMCWEWGYNLNTFKNLCKQIPGNSIN